MPILIRLKEETKSLHEATEVLLFGPKIMAGELTLPEYKQLLWTNLAYHASLEQALARYPDFFAGYQVHKREKKTALLTDLNALGEGLPTDQDDYFHGWTTYQLLGAAYVGEGSTLGSRFISSALKKNLHLPDTAKASRFYDGYGIETGSLWSEFRAFLTAKAIGHDDEVVEGAEAAFRLYRQLFLHLSTPMYQSEA